MKAQDYFRKLKSQAKLENEDFNKFIEALPDTIEIPDIAVNLLEENFMTKERAAADSSVITKIRKEALDGVDAKIKEILPVISQNEREAIQKEENTFKKVQLLKAAFETSINAAKQAHPDDADQVKNLKKVQQDLLDQIKNINSERENEKKDLLTGFEKEKTDLRLNWTLDKKLGEFDFGDEYKGIKESITKGIIDTIKTNHVLELDDKGNIAVLEVDATTKATKPKFNGNTQVTIDDLLNEPLKPFLKKNNTDGQQQRQRQAPQNQSAPTDPNKMTLAQRRAAGARLVQ